MMKEENGLDWMALITKKLINSFLVNFYKFIKYSKGIKYTQFSKKRLIIRSKSRRKVKFY